MPSNLIQKELREGRSRSPLMGADRPTAVNRILRYRHEGEVSYTPTEFRPRKLREGLFAAYLPGDRYRGSQLLCTGLGGVIGHPALFVKVCFTEICTQPCLLRLHRQKMMKEIMSANSRAAKTPPG